MANSEPAFNLPRSVLLAGLLMLAVQVVMTSLPEEEGFRLLLGLAFIPARYTGSAAELPGGEIASVTSFITYMFVHGGWVHLGVNLAWMVAFGSAVAKRVGDQRFLLFSALCGIAGVLTHLALHWGAFNPVVGASAAISGQMAAAIRFLFSRSRSFPEESGETDFGTMPLASLGQTFSDPRIVAFLAIWIGLNMLFGLGYISLAGMDGGIAWEAHVGGFLFGLLFFGFFDVVHREEEPRTLL
jgi:membrane associated rhomboid family serine protease